MWADVQSRLPVRIEMAKGESGKGRLQVTAHAFEWDVSADDSMFTPVIADDYTASRPRIQLGAKK